MFKLKIFVRLRREVKNFVNEKQRTFIFFHFVFIFNLNVTSFGKATLAKRYDAYVIEVMINNLLSMYIFFIERNQICDRINYVSRILSVSSSEDVLIVSHVKRSISG